MARTLQCDAKMQVLPAKPGVAGPGRRIVYLDQMVVSDMAKVRLGRRMDVARASALKELSDALHVAVGEKETARCVESFFHRGESSALVEGPNPREGARDLFDAIGEDMTILTWRLHLVTAEIAATTQTFVPVAASQGLPSFPLWKGGFLDDPQTSNAEKGVKWEGTLFAMGVRWEPRTIGSSGAGWAARCEALRAGGRYATREAALAEIGEELRDWAIACNTSKPWMYSWGATLDGGVDQKRIDAFIRSEAFLELPYPSIIRRLYARVLSDKSRRLKDSDYTDMVILALAIPYCDLVIADSFMANVAKELKLGTEFSVTILPGGNDGLREAAGWLAGLS
jgi:hypothetical protein